MVMLLLMHDLIFFVKKHGLCLGNGYVGLPRWGLVVLLNIPLPYLDLDCTKIWKQKHGKVVGTPFSLSQLSFWQASSCLLVRIWWYVPNTYPLSKYTYVIISKSFFSIFLIQWVIAWICLLYQMSGKEYFYLLFTCIRGPSSLSFMFLRQWHAIPKAYWSFTLS